MQTTRADAIAGSCTRRYASLLERDNLVQVAHLELVRDSDSPEVVSDHGLVELLDQLPAAEVAALRLKVLVGLSLRQAGERCDWVCA
jgi:DNA-directed RNA polymerase specialized sigma24 family protein